MLFILAVAVGIVLGVVSHNYFNQSTLARVAAAVAGFIVGFWGTYLVAANIR